MKIQITVTHKCSRNESDDQVCERIALCPMRHRSGLTDVRPPQVVRKFSREGDIPGPAYGCEIKVPWLQPRNLCEGVS
jgi:hypothetical protein